MIYNKRFINRMIIHITGSTKLVSADNAKNVRSLRLNEKNTVNFYNLFKTLPYTHTSVFFDVEIFL